MSSLAWPADLGRGQLVGRFAFMDADSADVDEDPDITAAAGGTIVVTPSIASTRYTGTDGPMILAARRATAIIDADGYLCAPAADGKAGTRGIVLPATDDEDLSPTGWTYRIAITLPGGISLAPFNIALPAGETVDISLAVPVPSNGGTATVVDTTTAARAEDAALAAEEAAARAEEAGGIPGQNPAFATLAAALAWEAANPGRIAYTEEKLGSPADPDIEVTPAAVTFNDAGRTYTVPAVTGVRYLVGGILATAGTVPVGDVAVMINATAEAEEGYVLTGTAAWSHSWDAAPVDPETTVLDLAAADAAVHVVHFAGGTVHDDGTDGATWAATDVGLADGIATFNGTTSRLASDTTTGGTYGAPAELTVIVVCTPTASVTGAAALGHSYATLVPSDASKRQYAAVRGTGAVAVASTANTAPTGTRACVAWRYSAAGLETVRDGVRLAGPTAGSGPLTAVAGSPVYVGSAGTTYFAGTIEHVVLVRGALTDARLLEYAQAAGTA